MSASVQHPHEKLFRTVFADTEEAALFLGAYLPTSLAERVAWSTLTLVETSFVDEALRESESDLLFTVQMKESGEQAFLYVLFEHQSQPDPWMRFRLLKYMCRIWDASFKQHPAQSELPPILPVVFYQGVSAWRHSTAFTDLFPEGERGHSFLPRFAHYLIDQSGLAPEAVQGGLKARVAQLLMMAAYRAQVQEALEVAAALMAQVPRTGGVDYVGLFVVYLAATQDRQVVNEFAAAVQRYAPGIGGDMLTYAEELRQEGKIEGRIEGRIEGKIEGKIETIESLLAVGADWSLIIKATGITPDEFQRLKAELEHLGGMLSSAHDQAKTG